ncbi:MAG: DUF502 domain-containing protein [Burkholderiales bacterium]
MKTSRQQIVNTFVTGMLAALPIVATVLIVIWAVRFLYAYLGPGSWFGDLMQVFGFGMASEWVAYLIGLAVVVAAIFFLGLLVRFGLAKFVANLLTSIVQRIPVVRNIYDVVKSLVDLFAQRDQEKLNSMSPVWLHFGGGDGVAVLGLLSTREPVLVAGKPYYAVIVPTAPVPVGGGLIYVPQDWVTPADVGVDGLTSIYVSMGVTSNQHIGLKKPAGDSSA